MINYTWQHVTCETCEIAELKSKPMPVEQMICHSSAQKQSQVEKFISRYWAKTWRKKFFQLICYYKFLF